MAEIQPPVQPKMVEPLMQTLQISRKLLTLVGKVEIAVACCILGFIVIMIIAQVGLNAGLGNPIAWEQEGGAYALVWLTFLGASVGLKQLRHVRIISFVSSLSPKWESMMRALVFGIIIWLLCLVMMELTQVIPIESRAQTIALPIDVPRSWFFSVPLMISCILMLWTSVHYFLEHIANFLSSEPVKPKPVLETESTPLEAEHQ